jgi:hypothetical protein
MVIVTRQPIKIAVMIDFTDFFIINPYSMYIEIITKLFSCNQMLENY